MGTLHGNVFMSDTTEKLLDEILKDYQNTEQKNIGENGINHNHQNDLLNGHYKLKPILMRNYET